MGQAEGRGRSGLDQRPFSRPFDAGARSTAWTARARSATGRRNGSGGEGAEGRALLGRRSNHQTVTGNTRPAEAATDKPRVPNPRKQTLARLPEMAAARDLSNTIGPVALTSGLLPNG
jgi:hypothetical protein